MRIRIFLLPLIAAIPLLEILSFVIVGREIGAWRTLGLTILSMAFGMVLVRYQGMLTFIRAREAFARGEPPAMALLEGLLLLLSGFLFLIPGFFTDILGALLLIPFLRRALIYAWLARAWVSYGPPRRGKTTTIEGEFHREDDPRIRREDRGPRDEE